MIASLERVRGRAQAGCLSDLALDQLWTGEAAGTLLEQSRRAHLAECFACTRRLRQIEATATALLARHPTLRPSAPAARPWWRRWARTLSGGTALAGAAAAVALFLQSAAPPELGVRMKGAPVGLEAHVKHHDGSVGLLEEDGPAHPGDVLQFTITPRADGFVGVISIDGAGTVSSYGPIGPHLAAARAGQPLRLDRGVQLDDVLGRERLIVFACPEALETRALAGAVRALVQTGRVRPDRPLNVAPGCAQSSTWFEKVAPR